MVKKIIKFIFVELIYNGHLQSVCAVCLTVFCAILLNIKIDIISLLILYLSFYLIYLYNRYKELATDSETNHVRSKHVAKINNWVPHILIFDLIFTVALIYFFSNLWFGLFVAVIIIFGMLYTDFFKRLTKKIFIFKNLYVALFFGSLSLAPVAFNNLSLKEYYLPFCILFIFIFFRALRMQIILDLKDIKSDRQENLLTFGVKFGFQKAISAAGILSILTVFIFPIILFVFSIFNYKILFLILLLIFDLIVLKLIKKENILGYLLESGEFIIWPLLILY